MLVSTDLLTGSAFAEEGRERFLPPLVISGTTEEGFHLYGQLDKGLLVHDDGRGGKVYPLVDNAHSSTRFGAWLKSVVTEDLRFSANFELEWNPYATDRVDQRNQGDVDWGTNKLRKAEAILASDKYGRLWLGQGSMVSDGSAEADLSGTTVAADSDVGDAAGGQLIAFSDAGLSGIRIGGAFDNLDGLSRKVRARIDSPAFAGFRLGASIGSDIVDGPDDVVWDIGATYADMGDEFAVSAAAAYAKRPDSIDRFSASASALHKATGLNVTLAAGYEERTGRAPKFLYGKLGWRPELTTVGDTAFAVDVYTGNDFAVANSDSVSLGLAAVQTFDYYRTDVFVATRWYDFDGPSASYADAISVLAGARWRF